QLPCLDACGLVRRDTRHEHDLLRRLHGGEHDNRRLQTLLQAVHGTAQRTGICTFDLGCHDLHTLDIDRARSEIGALAGSQAVLESPDLLLHLPDALEHILHLVLHVFARAAHELGEVAQQAVVLLHVLDCGLARDRLDAAYARGNTAFTEDLEEADVSGPLHVSAAAELHREISDAQHANVLVVFLTEERHRAGGDRVLVSHELRLRRRIETDLRVHRSLDGSQLPRCDRLEMREIEPQPVGRNQRALLLDVFAQSLAKRRMQQVRCSVIQRDGSAPHAIDIGTDYITDTNRAFRDAPTVGVRRAALDGVMYGKA